MKTKNAMFENLGISLYLQPVSHRLYLSHLFLLVLLQLPLIHLRRFPRQSFRSLHFSLSFSKMQLLAFGRHGYASALCNTWRCKQWQRVLQVSGFELKKDVLRSRKRNVGKLYIRAWRLIRPELILPVSVA